MLEYIRDGSAQIIVHTATLTQKLQIKLSVSPSRGILTPGRLVPALTYNARRLAGQPLECQFLSHWYDSTRKNPGASGNRTPDALTTRPTRRSLQRRAYIQCDGKENGLGLLTGCLALCPSFKAGIVVFVVVVSLLLLGPSCPSYAQAIVRAATLRQKVADQLTVPPSKSTDNVKTSPRVATRVSMISHG